MPRDGKMSKFKIPTFPDHEIDEMACQSSAAGLHLRQTLLKIRANS